MRNLYALLLMGSAPFTTAQQVLFSENFEGTPAFTLNTTDAGSVVNNDNTWVINNVYAGGSGTIVCLGFPLPFNVPSTASQPAGISNQNGKYLHTASIAALNSGVQCCCFVAADGLCAAAASHFARMNTDVSTVGLSNVSLSFWWLCGGGNNNYGEVYYSTNGGSSWTQITTPLAQYRNQFSWTQQTISLPAFDNQPTLRFGFRFFNGTTASAQDPGFALDDVRITVPGVVPPSVTTGSVTPTSVCTNGGIAIPYTANGTYNAGNVFTAYLSNAAGSFASPTAIGSQAGTTSGVINAIIPFGTPAGTGYRVRVDASSPAVTGTPNTGNITIAESPYAGEDALVALCKNTGIYNLFQFLGGDPATCGGWTGPNGTPVSGLFDTGTDQAGTFTYTTNCPGGCPQDQATVVVNLINPANAGQDVSTSLCSNGPPVNLYNLVSGGDITGIFFYQGQPTNGSMLNTPGVYNITYVVYGNPPCENDSATFVITVNAAANAGNSATATICQNSPPVPLIGLLGGSPQTNGSWTNPLGQPHSGTFNPAVDGSGLYTYTVPGTPPCTSAQAFIAVVVDPCLGIGEPGDAPDVRWAGVDAGGAHVLIATGVQATGYELLDAGGRIVQRFSGVAAHGRYLIDPSGMAPGIYVVRVHTASGVWPVRIVHGDDRQR